MVRIKQDIPASLANLGLRDNVPSDFKASLEAALPRKQDAETLDDKLASAVAKGDVEALRKLLADLPAGTVNGVDDKGRTALHLALEAPNSHELVRLLVETGAIDLAALDANGKSALQLALEGVAAATDPRLIAISEYLLGRTTGALGKAIAAKDTDRVKALLKAGASPKGVYSHGVTFLARAAADGNVDLLRALLEAIPEDERAEVINRHDAIAGNTAMHAAKLGGDEVFELLKDAGGDLAARNAEGKTPSQMKVLARRGDQDYVGHPYGTLGWNDLLTGMGPMEPPPPAPSAYEFGGGYAIRPYQQEEQEARETARELSERLGYQIFLSWQVENAGTRNESLVVQIGNIVINGGAGRSMGDQMGFIAGQLRNMRQAGQHFTGRHTLDRLFSSNQVLRLHHDDYLNSIDRDPQTGVTVIRLTGDGGIDATTAGETWGSPEQSPPDVVMMEYLIRAADHFEGLDSDTMIMSANGVLVEENWARAIGLGEFWSREGTLNGYRGERGLQRRTFYDDVHELDATGSWREATVEEQLVARANEILARAGINAEAEWVVDDNSDDEVPTVSLRMGDFEIFGVSDSYVDIPDQIDFINTVLDYFDLIAGWQMGPALLQGLQTGVPVIIERAEEGTEFADDYHFDPELQQHIIRLSGQDAPAAHLDGYVLMGDSLFVHEMIHAHHQVTGTTDLRIFDIDRLRHNVGPIEEAAAIGLGPFSSLAMTQRNYDRYRGYEERLIYGNVAELDHNGNWGGISATNPTEWWAQYNEIRRYEAEQREHRWERRSSEEDGYQVIETEREYEELMSGGEGVVTRFSYDHEFKDIIRFHQEKDGEIINQGVIDKVATPKIASRAMYERDFMDRVQGGGVDFRALLMLRFKTDTGRPEWSPALDRAVDDWLKTAPLSTDQETRMADEIAADTGTWSRQELRMMLDSGVIDARADLKDAVTQALQPQDEVVDRPVLNDEDYDRVLNDLVETIRAGTDVENRQTLAMDGSLAERYKQLLEYKRRHPTPDFVNTDDLDEAQVLNQQVLDDFLPRLRNHEGEADVFEGYLGHHGGHAALSALADEVAGAPPVSYDGDVTRFFQESVMQGDVAEVAELISDNPDDFDINAEMPIAPGMNALEVLVAQGWNARDTMDMARVLIKGGIDLTHVDNEGMSAYQRAQAIADDGVAKGDFKALAALIRSRMNDELGEAIAAGDNDAVARLVKAGADPNAPLLEAVYTRDVEMVEMILDNMPEGADINALDGYGKTALHQAVLDTYANAHLDSSTELITLLIDKGGADVMTKDSTGRTAYELIAPYGEGESVRQDTRDKIAILRDKATEELREATANNADEATIEALIKAGAVRD